MDADSTRGFQLTAKKSNVIINTKVHDFTNHNRSKQQDEPESELLALTCN